MLPLCVCTKCDLVDPTPLNTFSKFTPNICRVTGYFYAAIWNRNQVGLQAPGLAMMRTNDLMDPGSWRCWDGNAYTRSFASPYTLEPGTEAEHVCQVTNLPAGTCIPIEGKKRVCMGGRVFCAACSCCCCCFCCGCFDRCCCRCRWLFYIALDLILYIYCF